MNLALLVPIVSQAVGRDVTPDVEMFFRARAAVGSSLSPEGQRHFVANWRKLVDYMETEKGQASLRQFLGDWEAASRKPVGEHEVEEKE